MGQITNPGPARDNALREAHYAVGPTIADGPGGSLAASTDAITGLNPGDQVQVYANGDFHAAFATGAAIAAIGTTPGPFPGGIYRWTCPDGCDKVVMIEGAAGAASGGAFKG